MENHRLLINTITIAFLILNISCCKKSNLHTTDYPNSFSGPKYHFTEDKTPVKPDYSELKNWMLMPDTPKNPTPYDVDLIWLNPTTFVSDSLWNMPMNDEAAKLGALNDFKAMAGIFNESCNIYSPYYRQACLAVLSAKKEDFDAAFQLANTDAARAIEFYFEHYNNGRRFILAGHSQGANHFLTLLKNNPTLNQHLNQMIVAYIVGWSVTNEDTLTYPQLNICDSATEQGCIITYNTIENGFQEEAASVTLLPNSITVNPLFWNTSEELAPNTLHKGAIFSSKTGFDTIYNYTSAQNINGLCVERPINVNDFLVFEPYFHPGIYHVYDYEFFHLNLKDNLTERIRALNK